MYRIQDIKDHMAQVASCPLCKRVRERCKRLMKGNAETPWLTAKKWSLFTVYTISSLSKTVEQINSILQTNIKNW